MHMHCHERRTRSEAACQGSGQLSMHLRRVCYALYNAAVLRLMQCRVMWTSAEVAVLALRLYRPP